MKEEGRKKIKNENTKVKLMKFQISIFFARRKGKFYFIFYPCWAQYQRKT